MYINFVGLMCRGTKKICRNFRGKQTSTENVIALAITCLSPHPTYSIKWRILIYASFSTLYIWTYDAYMRQSKPKVLIHHCIDINLSALQLKMQV